MLTLVVRGLCAMSSQQQQITIDDLRSNWEADVATDYPPERMPPWDAACFNRACGQDTTGTLYIGRGRPLSSRLNALRRSLRRGSPNHGASETLRYYARLNQNFPPNKLAIAVLRCFKCEHAEGDLLDAYINSFGEIPPLNQRWD
jgi:hypothetical protein